MLLKTPIKTFLAIILTLPLAFAQDDLLAHARKLSAEAIGIDSHIDTIQHVLVANADLAQNLPYAHADFPKLREGGMKAPFFVPRRTRTLFAIWASA